MSMAEKLPTVSRWLESRRSASKNQLPRHLRPDPLWPLALQLALNSAIIVTLITLVIDKDDYLTEAGPAITLVIALVFLIMTIVQAVRLRNRFPTGRGSRWAKINLVLMVIAFLSWAGSVAYFLN